MPLGSEALGRSSCVSRTRRMLFDSLVIVTPVARVLVTEMMGL